MQVFNLDVLGLNCHLNVKRASKIVFRHPAFAQADVFVLKRILKELRNSNPKIYEIGCWTGQSTAVLAEYAKENKGHVYAIDTFDGRGSRLEKIAVNENIYDIFVQTMEKLNLLEYITIIRNSSDVVWPEIENESIDFLFIDGDHRYGQIKKDLDHWWLKIKKGGILCGHDCEGKEYDEKYINEDFVNQRHHGVCKAVFEKFPDVKLDYILWWIKK